MTRRVLVTRAAGSWPALDARFAGSSIFLQWTPTTSQVDPVDRAPGDLALLQLPRCDWLVVTSGRGVAALARRVAEQGTKGRSARVAAVGPATARALASIGMPADVVGEDFGAVALAAQLAPYMTAESTVVIVRPEGAPSELAVSLRASGAKVFEAPLYRTVASVQAEPLVAVAIAGEFAGVVFTAPSSLTLWLDVASSRKEALLSALSRAALIAIGPTTAEALASAGVPADEVADTPSEQGVGDAIVRALHRSTC